MTLRKPQASQNYHCRNVVFVCLFVTNDQVILVGWDVHRDPTGQRIKEQTHVRASE